MPRLGIKEPSGGPFTVLTGTRNNDGSPVEGQRQPASGHTYLEALQILADISEYGTTITGQEIVDAEGNIVINTDKHAQLLVDIQDFFG